jgi:hypothetical protein
MDGDDPNWLRDHPGWPRNPRGLSAQVAEITANLRVEKWAITKVGQRAYEIRWLGADDDDGDEEREEGARHEGDDRDQRTSGWGRQR